MAMIRSFARETKPSRWMRFHHFLFKGTGIGTHKASLPPRGQICRLLAVRADPRPTRGTAAARPYGDRALRTPRRLAV